MSEADNAGSAPQDQPGQPPATGGPEAVTGTAQAGVTEAGVTEAGAPDPVTGVAPPPPEGPPTVAADTPTDQLPEDLQPHLVDPEDYVFPNNNRRRIPGYIYLGVAAALAVLVAVRGTGVFVNRGFLGAALVLVVFGIYSLVSGWNLNVDERDALVVAVAQVGFPVGHASAQMGWRGLLSRPTWRILLYSADDPPTKRGFVLVDGVHPKVVDWFVEDNPEDWSQLTGDDKPAPAPGAAGAV